MSTKMNSSSSNNSKNEDMSGSSNMEEYEDDCQAIFPQRLMNILSDESNTDAICWLPHGRAFIIRNRKSFAEKVMPKYFSRKSKYSSFTRKLNRWDFQRVSSGPELGAYYHEFFLRDKPQLAAQMFCKNQRTKMAMSTPTVSPASALMNANTAGTANVAKNVPSDSETVNNASISSNNANNNANANKYNIPATAPAINPLFQEQKMLEQKLSTGGSMDIMQLYLAGQGMDRQTRMLVERQLLFMKQQQQLEQLKQSQLQQQKQQQQNSLAANQGASLPSQQNIQSQLLNILTEKNADINRIIQNTNCVANNANAVRPFLMGSAMANLSAAAVAAPVSAANANFDPVALRQQMREIQAHKQQQARMLQIQQLMAANLQRQQRKSRKSNNFRASAA